MIYRSGSEVAFVITAIRKDAPWMAWPIRFIRWWAEVIMAATHQSLIVRTFSMIRSGKLSYAITLSETISTAIFGFFFDLKNRCSRLKQAVLDWKIEVEGINSE